MTRAFPIRFAALILSGLALAPAGCNNDDDRSTATGRASARLTLAMDAASCGAGPTVLAIDEVLGVDVDFRFDSINLRPGDSFELRVPAPGTYRVRFAGYDARGRYTLGWDFQTTLAVDEKKTEVLDCAGAVPSASPGREHHLPVTRAR